MRAHAIRPPEPSSAFEGGFVIEGRRADILDHIAGDRVSLAIWHRDPPSDLAAWLDRLPEDRLPHGRVLVHRTQASTALDGLCGSAGTPDRTLRDALIEDMAELIGRFAAMFDSPLVDARIEAIRHDACWKFHRDRVPVRLVTTYRGPGTQWVMPKDAARALEEQRAYAGPVHGLPRFAVALFKGAGGDAIEMPHAGGDEGIVHRSPPVADTGTTRLLLCLNLPSAASPPVWTADAGGAIAPPPAG